MNFQELTSYNWAAMLPEIFIIVTIIFLMLSDLLIEKQKIRNKFGYVAIIGVLLSSISLVVLLPKESTSILNNSFYLDGISKSFKLILLFGSLLSVLLGIEFKSTKDFERTRTEYYYLFLFALLGGMFLASSNDLIVLFVSIELLSISSFILVGIQKSNHKSSEAALKYVINGSISVGITLFGFSYLYGLTGTTKLHEMASFLAVPQSTEVQLLLSISFLLVLVGLSFKVATVPFHMWAPDAYEGASTPVTAFLSVVSKSAGFILFIRIFYTVFVYAKTGNVEKDNLFEMNQIFIGVLAGITMLVGNLAALRQKNLKRMLAYSSIAHAGYVLAAFSASNAVFSFDAIWFYLAAYLFMTFGIFTICQYASYSTGDEQSSALAGLYKSSPALAVTASIFLLSLAGIPGTAGFIGKLNILTVLLNGPKGLFVLAGILLLATVISYAYYFRLMAQLFFRETNKINNEKLPINIKIVLVICLIGTVLLGIYPSLATDFFHSILY
ncbi:MAG: NADH:ubiquinone oxidoreductase subunit [Bacillales bacterium]|jgi:NADH-quinone oxidoreductase subunit N|nr:NADH:ubiquinone oxidoreductase subunit [Bacillales bacterium]